MSKLTKFPVTMPDGTEYRVKIEEYGRLGWEDAYAAVTIYTERKGRRLFRFKRLAQYTFSDGRGGYDSKNPDYIELARLGIGCYMNRLQLVEGRKAAAAEELRQRSRALREFSGWDGKITEGDAQR